MVVDLVYAAETVTLVVAAGIVLYPLVTHPANVLHSTAVIALAASLLLLTVGTVALVALSAPAIANGFMVAATLSFAWSQWLLCREFAVPDAHDPFTFEEHSGGFEDARRE